MVSELTLVMSRPAIASATGSISSIKEASTLPVVDKGRVVAANGKDTPASKQSDSVASPDDVKEAVHKMRDYMQTIDRDLSFSIDEESGVTVVKVIDPTTNEVVRQIPSEDVMKVLRSLQSGGGLLSDVKA